MDLGLRSCLWHGEEECTHFCLVCRVPICRLCSGHHTHLRQTCGEFCRDCMRRIPDPLQILQLRDQLKSLLDETNVKGKEVTHLRQKVSEELQMYESAIVNGQNILQKEVDLLEKLQVYLAKVKDNARTVYLKQLCDTLLHQQSPYESIEEDIRIIPKRIQELTSLKNKYEEDEKRLFIRKLRISYLEEALKNNRFDDDDVIFCFLMLNEEGLLNIEFMNEYSLYYYKAFPDVEKKSELHIDKIEKIELVDIGCGIKISSDPLLTSLGLRSRGKNFSITLSHTGVLGIYSLEGDINERSEYTEGEKKCILQLTKLTDNTQIEIELENNTTCAFYDNNIIILTWREKMRETDVNKLFSERSRSCLVEITESKVAFIAETSLLHSTRVLYYRSATNDLKFFNVDSREDKIIATAKRDVAAIASFTGIQMNASVLFQERDKKATYKLNKNGEYSIINDYRTKFGIKSVLPSSLAPHDINKAAIKYGDFIYFQKTKISLYNSKLLGFEQALSLVRLYKDVFLVLNMLDREWVIMRIVIPEELPEFERHYARVVDSYAAFPNAFDLFKTEIEGLNIKSAHGIDGIQISESIEVLDWIRPTNCEFISLSHTGILACYRKNCIKRSTMYTKKLLLMEHAVQFVNLTSRQQVELAVENKSNTAFYDDKIVILTLGMPLREIKVRTLLRTLNISAFETISKATVRPWTDVSLVHTSRLLLYSSTDGDVYSYDVDICENKKVWIGNDYKVWNMASLTGIHMDINALFRLDNGYIYSIDSGLKQTREGRDEFENCITAVLPSSKRSSSDIHSYALMHWNSLSFINRDNEQEVGGRKITSSFRTDTISGYTITRLWRDVFLFLNGTTEHFNIVKIVVMA